MMRVLPFFSKLIYQSFFNTQYDFIGDEVNVSVFKTKQPLVNKMNTSKKRKNQTDINSPNKKSNKFVFTIINKKNRKTIVF